MSDWYDVTGSPVTGSGGSSSVMRGEFALIAQEFAKLPLLTSKASLPVFVNAGASALESITALAARGKLGLGAADTVEFNEVKLGTTTLNATDWLRLDGLTSNAQSQITANVDSITALRLLPTVQEFIAGGTWTRPAGCRYIVVEGSGAGGGGGGSGTVANRAGGGGGAGGYFRILIDVTSLASQIHTVGVAGAGGTLGSAGAAGTSTVFGAFSATGGMGGLGGASTPSNDANGGQGIGGDVNIQGGSGSSGSSTHARGGDGGGSFFGGGAGGSEAVGGSALSLGSGGAGGGTSSGVERNGGSGRYGALIITEYY